MSKMGISSLSKPMGRGFATSLLLTTNQRTESVHHLIASCFDTEYKCENKKIIEKFGGMRKNLYFCKRTIIYKPLCQYK